MTLPSAPPPASLPIPAFEAYARKSLDAIDERVERLEGIVPRVERLERDFGAPADPVARTPATGVYDMHERLTRLNDSIDALRAAIDADRRARQEEEQRREEAATREAAALKEKKKPVAQLGWDVVKFVIFALLALLGGYMSRHWSWASSPGSSGERPIDVTEPRDRLVREARDQRGSGPLFRREPSVQARERVAPADTPGRVHESRRPEDEEHGNGVAGHERHGPCLPEDDRRRSRVARTKAAAT